MDAGKLRTGHKILIDGQPYIVVDYSFRQQPRLAAKMITKLRNLITGGTIDKTFTSGDYLEDADIVTSKSQYLYNDGTDYTFMDNETFEQFSFNSEKLGDMTYYLKDDMEVFIMKFNGNPINVELPPTVDLKVIETGPGVKGDTATGGTKPATLETGLVIQVPLYLEEGEIVTVSTINGEFRSRAKN